MSERRHRRGRGGQGGHEPRARIRTREQRALELTVLGWPQHKIAADLGISQAAVSKILKRVDTRLLQGLLEAAGRQKVRHTLRLEHLYAELMQAWEDSKADTTRRRQRQLHDGRAGASATVAEIVVENQHGDPRYLESARQVLADLRKLWGLDAPQQLAVRATQNPYDGMSEEALRSEWERQARLLSNAEHLPVSSAPNDPSAPDVADSTDLTDRRTPHES